MIYYCTLEKQDDVYYVEFPDLPNVFTFGNTKDEALKMAAEALNGVLESEITRGIKIPFPSFTSEYPIEVEPSIAFTLMLRKKRGLQTQNEIAKKLNISYQQYQQLENPKKANPTLKTIAKLQKIFNYRFVNF
jgi:hypothetical protein